MKRKFVELVFLPLAKLYWKVCKPKTIGCRAMIIKDSEILLIKDIGSPNRWKFPGGGKRKREAPEMCTVREVQEEVGIESTILRKHGTFISQKQGKRDTIHVYIVTPKNTNIKLQWELFEAAWFPLDTLPENITSSTKRRIDEYKNGIQPALMAEW